MWGLQAQVVGFEPPRGAPIFEHLGAAEAEVLQALYTIRPLAERDDHLVAHRDPAPPVITLLSGWAFRYSLLPDGRRQILNLLLPGDTIGLAGLLEHAPAYPVQCATAVVYAEIGFPRACKLAGEAEWFRRLALEALSRGRRMAEVGMIRLGQGTAEERLAAVLLELQDELVQRGLVMSGGFTMPLSHAQLADLIGVTPIHLGRVLGALKRRGLVTVKGQRVTLPDPSALQSLVRVPVFPAGRPVFPGSLLV